MRRFIVVTPIAILLSFIVFVAMAWLVRTPSMTAEAVAVESVDFIVSEQEDQLVRRTRSLPEPKETLPEPQVSDTITSPKSHVSEPHRALSALPIGNVEVEVANTNVSVANIAPVNYSQQANLSVQVSSSQQAMPLYRVEPFYPAKARQRRAEGYVIIRFNIDESGSPVALEVIEAKPKRLFEREALKALKQWRYQPKLAQGKAITQIGQTVKLEFKYPK
ncbi:energy transducer TonB [Vibrio sinaloensis]|uniref:energy transducer TonB n=1 Tax=Photobacterium sp. (strain ATCC 43367) TaxID=379097 RepID=UPI0035EFB940